MLRLKTTTTNKPNLSTDTHYTHLVSYCYCYKSNIETDFINQQQSNNCINIYFLPIVAITTTTATAQLNILATTIVTINILVITIVTINILAITIVTINILAIDVVNNLYTCH